MIYLSNDIQELILVLDMPLGETAIRNIIELYLKAYGTQYDFAQFYIQTDENFAKTALILRYNQSVYCVTDTCCDFEEISDFIRGFADTEVVSDILLDVGIPEQTCAVMSIKGENITTDNKDVSLCNDPKLISELVFEGVKSSKKTDFFLNTAHQMRHNLLSVFVVSRENKPISVASVYENDDAEAVIPFVYTSEYFRGNGFSSAVLKAMCCKEEVTYRLLCEEHNVEFYKKCGFSIESAWYKYVL